MVIGGFGLAVRGCSWYLGGSSFIGCCAPFPGSHSRTNWDPTSQKLGPPSHLYQLLGPQNTDNHSRTTHNHHKTLYQNNPSTTLQLFKSTQNPLEPSVTISEPHRLKEDTKETQRIKVNQSDSQELPEERLGSRPGLKVLWVLLLFHQTNHSVAADFYPALRRPDLRIEI